jgi:uncharacterized protein YkwD
MRKKLILDLGLVITLLALAAYCLSLTGCSGTPSTQKHNPPPAPAPVPNDQPDDNGFRPVPVWPPDPEPQPKPQPQPQPKPQPKPEPKPQPKPEPQPQPKPQPAPQPKPEPKPPDELTQEANQVLDLVNKQRQGKLASDPDLSKEAMDYAQRMGKEGQLTHTLDGQGLQQRLAQWKYPYTAAGENIAMGQKDPQTVVNAWMHSAGHRANIMNNAYNKTGVGVFKDQRGRMWWAQVFAKQVSQPSFKLEQLSPEISCPIGLKDPHAE